MTKVIAVMSGKGGSGKTSLSASLAAILAPEYPQVTLIDADLGTAGLTYFMGSEYVRNTRTGMADFDRAISVILQTDWQMPEDEADERKGEMIEKIEKSAKSRAKLVETARRSLQPIGDPRLEGVEFAGVGDHRRLLRLTRPEFVPEVLSFWIRTVIEARTQPYSDGGLFIVDCRGGVDPESIAVAHLADEIVLVTEADITAYQATRTLAEHLTDVDLGHKLQGFYLNKVFVDPAFIQSQGQAEFGCRSLAAIPFDLKATRGFFVGELPARSSPFNVHVEVGADKLMPDAHVQIHGAPWTPGDFGRTAITDIDGERGGVLAAAGILLVALSFYGLRLLTSGAKPYDPTVPLILIGLIGTVPSTRMLVGRVFGWYARLLAKFTQRRSR